jgi:SAM-dependent methyltransferase
VTTVDTALKQETAAAYDAYAARFDVEFESHMHRYNAAHTQAFMDAVAGRQLLDIGAGPGNYAVVFTARGFQVLCGDLSRSMVDLCRSKGLTADLLDLETFEIDRRFDGIWANACLLHLPRTHVPAALDRLARHLAPTGVLGCAVKEGEGEAMLSDPEYPGARRFFSYFTHAEFSALLEERFTILRHERTVARTGKTVFIKYLARVRS